jgi:hypothetical protein
MSERRLRSTRACAQTNLPGRPAATRLPLSSRPVMLAPPKHFLSSPRSWDYHETGYRVLKKKSAGSTPPDVRSSDGWIKGENLLLPSQRLDKPEVGPFLGFVFRDIAVRPKPLRLRETAGVVRSLLLLAWYGVPKEVAGKGKQAIEDYQRGADREPGSGRLGRRDRQARQQAEQLAKRIWGEALSHAIIRASIGSGAVKAFLKTHANTYLADSPDLLPAINFVGSFTLPPDMPSPFAPPRLTSRKQRTLEGGSSYLQDDLTERVFAAYHALRLSGAKGVYKLVADALTRGHVRSAKKPKSGGWTQTEVHDTVRRHEKRLRKLFRQRFGERRDVKGISTTLDELRDRVASKWIYLFLSFATKKSQPAPGQRGTL